MNYRTVVFVAFVNVLGLISVGDGSALGLGLLAPLLPVAQITGHAGLLAHGLSGAGLLLLKAAAAGSGLFLLSGRGIELNLGHKDESHGWGHEEVSHGWSPPVESHGWGWDSRKKRSTEETSVPVAEEQAPVATTTIEAAYDPSLDEVLAFDQLGCGMRLVCELSATPFTSLGEDEKLILELFGRDGKAPNPGKASKGKLTYSYASLLGANAKDGVAVCSRVYGHCPYDRQQIMTSLREAQV